MRFPSRGVMLFLFTWALVWAVPMLRHQTQRGLEDTGSRLWKPLLPASPWEIATRGAPNDPFGREQKLSGELMQRGSNGKAYERFFREYDALIAQNPTRLDLYRNRLRNATKGHIVRETHTDRVLTPKSAAQSARQGSPVVKFLPLWLNSEQLQKVVEQARRAHKLAPDDAFFPFIEAMALSGLGREEESLAALERAGRCSTFNDGVADEQRRIIAHNQKFAPNDWHETLLVWWSGLMPHFSGMRAVARDTIYSGIERYRAGDKAGAWRRWKIALEAGRAMRVGQSRGPQASLIGLLVGEALEQMTWNAINKEIAGFAPDSKLLEGAKTDRIVALNLRIKAFSTLARRDGQGELARWSEREMREIIVRQSHPVLGAGMDDAFAALGWKTPAARTTIQLRWLGAQVWMLALVGIGFWAMAQIAARGGRENGAGNAAVGPLSAFVAALWIGCALVALVGGAGIEKYATLWAFQGDESLLNRSSDPLGKWPYNWDGRFWWLLAFTTVATPLFYAWGQSRRAVAGEKTRKRRGFEVWPVLQIVAWLFALVFSISLWFDGQNQPYTLSDASVLWPAWAASVAVALFLAWRTTQTAFPAPPRLFLWALNAALALGFWVLTAYSRSDLAAFGAWIVGAAAIGLLGWNLWPLRSHPAKMRATAQVCGRVMANLALAMSLFYLAASLALLPTRVELNRNVERYIQQGEVDWMRAQQ